MLLISRSVYEQTCKGLPGSLQQLLQPYLRTSLILKPLPRGVIRGGFFFWLIFYTHCFLKHFLILSWGDELRIQPPHFSAETFFQSCSYVRDTTESPVLMNILIFQSFFFFVRGHVLAASRVWWLIKETWVISASVFTETPFCISSGGNVLTWRHETQR